MKNILLLSILSLSILGCGSNNDSDSTQVVSNDCTFIANEKSASIRMAGLPLNGPPPPPSECQEFIIFTNNGYIVNKDRQQTSYHFFMPQGYTTSFQAYPNTGYAFDGWYSNDNKIDILNFPYLAGENGAITIEAKMIPVSIQ